MNQALKQCLLPTIATALVACGSPIPESKTNDNTNNKVTHSIEPVIDKEAMIDSTTSVEPLKKEKCWFSSN